MVMKDKIINKEALLAHLEEKKANLILWENWAKKANYLYSYIELPRNILNDIINKIQKGDVATKELFEHIARLDQVVKEIWEWDKCQKDNNINEATSFMLGLERTVNFATSCLSWLE
jgi:hypothetical protein